jgi:hypothetical protein
VRDWDDVIYKKHTILSTALGVGVIAMTGDMITEREINNELAGCGQIMLSDYEFNEKYKEKYSGGVTQEEKNALLGDRGTHSDTRGISCRSRATDRVKPRDNAQPAVSEVPVFSDVGRGVD